MDFSGVALKQLELAANEAGVEVEARLADLENYVPPEKEFDLVIAVHVHPPPHVRRRMLRLAVDALCGGGMLLIVGRDRADFGKGPAGPSDLDRRYSPPMLRSELTGVQLIRCESVPRDDIACGSQVGQIDTVAWSRRASRS